ncbi:MAG: DNA topoisomerase IV subunit A [Malacoplasma sp.]|nr:DNA topoisomerase IV subunit A [Malacoplasma sp.]
MSNSNENDKIWNRPLEDILSESFGKYAKYIIQDRALPDVRDGLKPVQRRILYAMNELKIHFDKPYKKSARTVGEVIGKYHPHGDSSIYEAMVRMAQEWKNNIPLLDMQGNKGSIDGDSAAAMRYTECRLSKFGQLLLKNIDKDTVRMVNNFDDSEYEPTVLPSLLPNILVNGATGIAAGYATNIPPFNLKEVIEGIIFKILKPHCSVDEMLKIIKGPDFPTGGIILGKEGIKDLFETGKGKFLIRAKIEQEEVKNSKNIKRLIIKEIPFDTNKSLIVKSLDEIRDNNELPGFKEVRDDSDKNGISIVLDFETEKDLEVIKAFLFKKTQLQISYNANVVVIKDRRPTLAGINEILEAFIEHANTTVIKAAQFDLNKCLARKEIIEGLIKAISDIDTLVSLIKSSVSKDEAKQKIQDHFEVNEKQSEAIVNLRLYILTSYDTNKLKLEYDELLKTIAELQMIINSQAFRSNYIINILEGYKNDFGSSRKSIIEGEIEQLEIKATDIIEEIHGVCFVTRDNYIKFINDESITEFEIDKNKIKDGDIPVDVFKMSTLSYLVCITNRGKVITIPSYKIKFCKPRDNGIHINEFVTIDSFEKILLAFSVEKENDIDTQILIATKNSLIKRMTLSELSFAKTSKYLACINLKANDDEIVSAHILNKDHKEIVSVSREGNAIRYLIEEIPIVSRTASGVKNMNLKEDDCVAFSLPIPKEQNFLFFVANRGAKRIYLNDIALTSRAKLGKKIFSQVESNPYIIRCGFIISGRDSIFVLLENNQLLSLRVADIPISDTESRINLISKIDKNLIVNCSYLNIEKVVIHNNLNNNFLLLENSDNENNESQADLNQKNNKSKNKSNTKSLAKILAEIETLRAQLLAQISDKTDLKQESNLENETKTKAEVDFKPQHKLDNEIQNQKVKIEVSNIKDFDVGQESQNSNESNEVLDTESNNTNENDINSDNNFDVSDNLEFDDNQIQNKEIEETDNQSLEIQKEPIDTVDNNDYLENKNTNFSEQENEKDYDDFDLSEQFKINYSDDTNSFNPDKDEAFLESLKDNADYLNDDQNDNSNTNNEVSDDNITIESDAKTNLAQTISKALDSDILESSKKEKQKNLETKAENAPEKDELIEIDYESETDFDDSDFSLDDINEMEEESEHEFEDDDNDSNDD